MWLSNMCACVSLALHYFSVFVQFSTKQNEKYLNTKLLEIIKIQTFYIDHFSIWETLSKQYSPNFESHINYMKLYVRIVDFQLHLPNTLSNVKMD